MYGPKCCVVLHHWVNAGASRTNRMMLSTCLKRNLCHVSLSSVGSTEQEITERVVANLVLEHGMAYTGVILEWAFVAR